MANKKCLLITSSNDETIKIYICLDSIKDITHRIYKDSSKEKRFRMIIESIFRNQTNHHIYDRYSDYPGTSVIKLSKGKENIRIYCKLEKKYSPENISYQCIVLVKIHDKKVQSLSKKEINILKAIQYNEYEYKDWH